MCRGSGPRSTTSLRSPPASCSAATPKWRGPIWFLLNCLIIYVLERYYRFFGDELIIEYPTGSGHPVPLDLIASDMADRLISYSPPTPMGGGPPCFGWVDRLQHDPAWKDNLLFSEYFHGDNGAGLGAAHPAGPG